MLKNAVVLKHGPHDAFADEVVGYLLAFFGLATQIKHGFNLPFREFAAGACLLR